jgi:hypothetical protein
MRPAAHCLSRAPVGGKRLPARVAKTTGDSVRACGVSSLPHPEHHLLRHPRSTEEEPMKQALRGIVAAVVIVVGAGSVRADSIPVIRGQVSGLELCPQSLCGAAVFVGAFKGQVGFFRNTLGTIGVAVNHGPLPEVAGGCTPIPNGVWVMFAGLRRIEGLAAGGLCYNGDNTYSVSVGMLITSGGAGTLQFDGTLDHNVFPPTIQGTIDQ